MALIDPECRYCGGYPEVECCDRALCFACYDDHWREDHSCLEE